MAASTAKKPTAYREGRADKSKKPSIEIEIKPEGEEEEGMEGEEMDGDKPHSRKRSAKGAKHTKAPMDGGMYGKKPMDGEGCGCGGRKGKASCDGSCGKKMDRNDALTPQEYLAACELGIQGRSRSYIRARLDSAARLDLKCGNGAISEGEKCHVGAATKAQGPSRKTLTGRETGILSRERIKREGYYGSPLGGDPFSRKSQAKRAAAFNGAFGAAAGGVIGYALGGAKGAAIGAAATGALYTGLGAGTGALTAQINRSTSRAANRSLQREQFEKPIAASYRRKRASMRASGASRRELGEYDMKTAMRLAKGYDRIQERTRGRYGADSAWAAGFSPELDQLAI